MIEVAKPFLPPEDRYQKLISEIWGRNYLTNNGPVLKAYEQGLKEYFQFENLHIVGNGTIALQLAIKALQLSGEIITTPFSYIATSSSLVWENCTPVFVDINPQTLTIDPSLIEEKITNNTTGIVATHVFGNPCDIRAIDEIAKKHKLKVVFDGSHCFGVKYQGRSIFAFGDITTLSLHATKPIHSIEGGAVFTRHSGLMKTLRQMRNFGHDGPGKFNGVGINGKMSEMHAAMGLLNLDYANQILEKYRSNHQKYDVHLNLGKMRKQTTLSGSDTNHAYYPIILESESVLLKVVNQLNRNNIFPRRYFHPSLNTIEYLSNGESLPVSEDISSRILCLPNFYDITEFQIGHICKVINQCI